MSKPAARRTKTTEPSPQANGGDDTVMNLIVVSLTVAISLATLPHIGRQIIASTQAQGREVLAAEQMKGGAAKSATAKRSKSKLTIVVSASGPAACRFQGLPSKAETWVVKDDRDQTTERIAFLERLAEVQVLACPGDNPTTLKVHAMVNDQEVRSSLTVPAKTGAAEVPVATIKLGFPTEIQPVTSIP